MDTNKTAVSKVQEAFIAEIQSKGIAHVLDWIGAWYTGLADAEIADKLADLGGPDNPNFGKDPEVQCLVLEDELFGVACSVNNYSTGQGTNLLRQARTAALSARLRRLRGPKRHAEWEAARQRLEPATESA